MEKIVSKPIDEKTFKPFLNTIQQNSSNLPIEGDNDMTLIAFAGPTTYELVSRSSLTNKNSPTEFFDLT
jgi:hypothetical protein